MPIIAQSVRLGQLPRHAFWAGYPSPKAIGAISSRFQVQNQRTLPKGNPVIVAMRPHESLWRCRMFWISSTRFRLTPLAPPEVLAGDFDPLQPRQRPLPGQVALRLREDDGQMQHDPPRGAVLVDGLPEADDLDMVIPQPAQ